MSYSPPNVPVTQPTLRSGRFLAEARRRHGLSQQDLAERTGMTQTNISRIERDKVSPSVRTLSRLLEAMGETLVITTNPVGEPPPRGGNVPTSRLRADFAELTAGERVERAALLSRTASELAASRSRA